MKYLNRLAVLTAIILTTQNFTITTASASACADDEALTVKASFDSITVHPGEDTYDMEYIKIPSLITLRDCDAADQFFSFFVDRVADSDRDQDDSGEAYCKVTIRKTTRINNNGAIITQPGDMICIEIERGAATYSLSREFKWAQIFKCFGDWKEKIDGDGIKTVYVETRNPAEVANPEQFVSIFTRPKSDER